MLIPSGTVTNAAFLVTSQILSPPPLATVTRQLKTSSFLPIEQLPCFKDLKLTLVKFFHLPDDTLFEAAGVIE